MTFNFYLGSVPEKSSDKTAIIYLYLRSGASQKGKNTTIKINTGYKVLPKLWNPEKKCLRSGRKRISESDAEYVNNTNTKLSKIKADAQRVVDDLQASGKKYSLSEIQKEVEKKINPSFISEERKTFDQAKKNFVDSLKDDTTLSYQGRFQVLFNILDEYSLKSKETVSFEMFDNDFVIRFKRYLLETRKQNNNTINKIFKLLKQVLSYCIENKYYDDQSYLSWRKRIPKYIQPKIISLTESELSAINSLDLPDGGTLSKVRECFIFQANTGVRISDILLIQWNQIDLEKKEWRLRTKKTKVDIIVPLNDTALSILKKNKDNKRPLNLISSQKINSNLKTLCEDAKINTKVTTIRHEGGNVIHEENFKWELIGTHTAKKTFVTLMLEEGMRVETLMKITGQDYKSLKPYIDITNKAIHTEMKIISDKRKKKQKLRIVS